MAETDVRPIFVSHTSRDDAFVQQLRLALESQQLSVWADSRELTGGEALGPEIEEALERSRQVLVVVSRQALQSAWVRKEVSRALEIATAKEGSGYKVIPLLLGIAPADLKTLFAEEPVGIDVSPDIGGLNEALPRILASLGERLPTDTLPALTPVAKPVDELLLTLTAPKVLTNGAGRMATATATVIHEAAGRAGVGTRSELFTFNVTVGPPEGPTWLDDLRWYLERFQAWPAGVFRQRADRIEARLPEWGRLLYKEIIKSDSARMVVQSWIDVGDRAERRVSIVVERAAPGEATDEERRATREAAAVLLSLPWELLHDGRGYLFQGRDAVRVRRLSRSGGQTSVNPASLPIRVLLVSPRPEDDLAGYIDHRSGALPLVDALEDLGDLGALTVVEPPTFGALQKELQRAAEGGTPFDVIHFDGHGIQDPRTASGGLCFEDPEDVNKLARRRTQIIAADRLAEVMRDHRIPLVFLAASHRSGELTDPTASVAGHLLDEGVNSVVAVNYATLNETTRRFVATFYLEVARGRRIGAAMVAGQRELYNNSFRETVEGAGELRLQDWFVPVLYQDESDPQLVTRIPGDEVKQLQKKARRVRFGALPETPRHGFVGRSRELLTLERLLNDQPFAVIRGGGGVGKTTVAVELARWLLRTGRFHSGAFVSVERYTDARGILDSIGRQLLPEGEGWSVARFPEVQQARLHVERALRDHPTVIVLDNFETALGPDAADIFDLCRALLDAHPATRLIFTSREPLPGPFGETFYEIQLGGLDENEAIELVRRVLARQRMIPGPDDAGDRLETIVGLVNAVNRHPRALVLLAPEIARQGVHATTGNLERILKELDSRHPADRENSLYASVELSLRRLPPAVQELTRFLGVFHGGGQVSVMAPTLEVDVSTAAEVARMLVGVGLATENDYLHFDFDPALPSYVRTLLDDAGRTRAEERWADATRQFIEYLYEQQFTDAPLASRLVSLELPNLVALVEWAPDNLPPEMVVTLTSTIEQLILKSDHPRALPGVVGAREKAQTALEAWSHARYLVHSRLVDRLFNHGDISQALTSAWQLLQHCHAAGEDAYEDAAYDQAMASLLYGRVSTAAGHFDDALNSLTAAHRQFLAIAARGDEQAERMVSVVIGELGDCLLELRRPDEAAQAYEQVIEFADRTSDSRQAALSRRQLGTARLMQQRFAEARDMYTAAIGFFEKLDEPGELANTWHQLGMAQKELHEFDQAEEAYKRSLAIEVRRRNRRGEAQTLFQFGNLYWEQRLGKEAADFYGQASDTFAALHDLRLEAAARTSLAQVLGEQHQYDPARVALRRAIECQDQLGHGARIWETWDSMRLLEQAAGNTQGAAEAREHAITTYLAFRRAGGESQTRRAALYARVAQATTAEEAAAAESWLAELSSSVTHPQAKAAVRQLRAVLSGERERALADDPELGYLDAAELRLLLESRTDTTSPD